MPSGRKLLSVAETAEYLATTEHWVRLQVRKRRLPFHKVGRLVRFDAADLDAYLAANRVEAEGAA